MVNIKGGEVMENKRSRNVLFAGEQYEKMEKEAKKKYISVSALIRMYVADGLERSQKKEKCCS